MLTKHGHFPNAEQFIRRHADKPTRKPSRREKKDLSQFDAALSEVIRVEISPASTAQWLIDVMQGRTPAIETGLDTFKPHHRMSAVRELLKRAYDHDYDYTQTTGAEARPSSQPEAAAATSQAHPDASEQETGESEHPEHPIHPENPDSDEEEANLQEILDIIKRAAEETDPSEWEDENPSGHKSNTTMWDIIESQPEPVITEEHARIGAALFHEAVERQRAWRESDVKIPERKDHDHYDDG